MGGKVVVLGMNAEVEAGTKDGVPDLPLDNLWGQICLACGRLCCQDMAVASRKWGQPTCSLCPCLCQHNSLRDLLLAVHAQAVVFTRHLDQLGRNASYHV